MIWHRIFTASVLVLVAAAAAAQVPDVGSIHCIGNCGSSGGSAPSVRSAPGSSVPSGPSPAELEHQRKMRAGFEQNEFGVACFKKEDWDCAARYFQQALENRPADPVITQNLANAQAMVAQVQLQLRAAAAAAEAHQALENLGRSFHPSNGNGFGADFDGSGGSTASPHLSFMPGPQGGNAPAELGEGEHGCGPSTDSSMVNLCDATTNVVDPNRVKGRAVAPAQKPLQFMDGTAIPPAGHAASPARENAAGIGAFAYPSSAEKTKMSKLHSISQDANNELLKAIDANQRGDRQAASEAIQKTRAALSEANPLVRELDAAEQDRMRAGMKVLLQDPAFAATWNASVARIRQQEMAEFARADAQRQRMMDQIQQGHADQFAAQQMQAIADRLREAQVAAMQQSTRKLKAEAQRLLEQAAAAR